MWNILSINPTSFGGDGRPRPAVFGSLSQLCFQGHAWQALRNIWGAKVPTRWAMCKASILPALYYFGPSPTSLRIHCKMQISKIYKQTSGDKSCKGQHKKDDMPISVGINLVGASEISEIRRSRMQARRPPLRPRTQQKLIQNKK